jgi:hypothetical protein
MPVAELLTNASQSNLAVSHFAISRKSVSNVLEVYLQNSTQPHNPPKAQNKPSTNSMKTNISQNQPQEKIKIEHVPNQHSHKGQSRRPTNFFFLEQQHPLPPKKNTTKNKNCTYLFTRGITSDSEKYDFLPIGEEIRKFCNFKDYNPNLLGFTRTAPASSNVHT